MGIGLAGTGPGVRPAAAQAPAISAPARPATTAWSDTASGPSGDPTGAGTLTLIRARGDIIIGHRKAAAPFSYLSEGRDPSGYVVELCGHIAGAVRTALAMPSLGVRYLPVTADTALPMLLDGGIDLECGTTANTYTRQHQADFTHTVFITGTRLLVRARSRVQEIEDVAGGTVAALADSTSARTAAMVLRGGGIDAPIRPVATLADGVRALNDPAVWVLAADDVLLYDLINRKRRPDAWRVTGRLLSYEPYAIMLRRDESAFRRLANRALSALFRDGRIEAIFQRHFKPHGIPLSPLTRAAFALQAFPER